jgi:hypothetical protein
MLVCDRKYDLNILFEAERLLLNKVSWKVNIHTAFDLMELLLESCIDITEVKCMESLKEAAINWIAFSNDEYQLYHKYDQATIAFAALLNAFADEGMVKSTLKLKEFMLVVGAERSNTFACMNDMLLEVTKLDGEMVEDVSTSGSSEIRTTAEVKETQKDCKEFISKKRRRVCLIKKAEQTQIPQYWRSSKAKRCGRKK